MQSCLTHDPADRIVEIVKSSLTKPQAQNLGMLVIALLLAKSFVVAKVALHLGIGITAQSCKKRIQRILASSPSMPEAFQRSWVRGMLAIFAPGRKRVPLIIDWTLHKDICKSLWIGLPIGGRAVPIMFWLASTQTGGKGTQREIEDSALRQLMAWLPKRRNFVLLGDRGFYSLDRIAFLKKLGLPFVLRMRALTQAHVDGAWRTLPELVPELGERWQQSDVPIGKKSAGKARVNMVVVREPLRKPKLERDYKGRPTGQTLTQTTWFLATDLSLDNDIIALYCRRMQIEEFFRDLKSFLDLEQARLFHQEKRLEWLLWASTVGWVMSVLNSPHSDQNSNQLPSSDQLPSVQSIQAPKRAQRAAHVSSSEPMSSSEPSTLPGHTRPVVLQTSPYAMPVALPRYPANSLFREGLHMLLWRLIGGRSALTSLLRQAESKSERMRQRPQVVQRHHVGPTFISRVTTHQRQYAT